MSEPRKKRLIVASNRIPDKAPAAGGLAVALAHVLAGTDGIWLGWSGQHVAEPSGELTYREVGGVRIAGLDLTRDEFQAYYAGFANRILWPAFHLRLDLTHVEDSWYEGYRAVNGRFADAIASVVEAGDTIWVHDYHLIPLARELRRRGVRNRIGFYLHIPFPTPDALFAIPHHEDLILDLAAYDLVGLQAHRDVAAFREAAEQAGVVAHKAGTEPADFSRTSVAAFPIGSDPDAFAKLSTSPVASKMAARVQSTLRGAALILGVDRLDYSKGLPQRIEAYEKLLEMDAELRRRVHMLQVAPPSREMIQEYRETTLALEAAVGHLMGRFAEPDWQPLTYLRRPYSQASLAGLYRLARVGLVTPLRDGMNLVAHEYIAAQNPDDPGVLLLSRFAGAAEIFPDALQVNPFDTQETAIAIQTALVMPLDERIARWRALMVAARRHSVRNWADSYLAALAPTGRSTAGGKRSGDEMAPLPELYNRLKQVYSRQAAVRAAAQAAAR